MSSRSLDVILADWRAAEREHGAATDDELREAIEARIAALAAEHREALETRSREAHDLATPPNLTDGTGLSPS